jgi:hypothetical protein
MPALTGQNCGFALFDIELGLTLFAVAFSFPWPGIGSLPFSWVEKRLSLLAHRRALAIATVGLSEIILRIAILPFVPIPQPFVQDDFSFLLAAETFASGRLTNPTPAMWTHFESFHINMTPTYMSMYFPAQGLVLAAGKVCFGHPWFGLLVANALMCAAICWMLQAWLPATWAFLGGMMAVLHVGLFSYWINTYAGGASVAALGGALVLGALPRVMRHTRYRDGIWLAIGIVILALSRPYEGILLCLPVSAVLGRWLLFGKNRPERGQLMRRAAFPAVLILSAACWLAYYDSRVNGSALTLPYVTNRAQYASAPYFIWQSPRSDIGYRHAVMRDFYVNEELAWARKAQSLRGFLNFLWFKPVVVILFFAGIALLPPLIMARRVVLDRRMRLLVVCLLIGSAGMILQIFMLVHYLAPFTAVFFALGLQAMRHLRVREVGGKPVGRQIVRLTVSACLLMVVVRVIAEPLHLDNSFPVWPNNWYGPGQLGAPRARVQSALENLPGKQLAIVRYGPTHAPEYDWVYNPAKIDDAKVIWAREMSPAENNELIEHYPDRKVWLVQPDEHPPEVSPYRLPLGTQNPAPEANRRP